MIKEDIKVEKKENESKPLPENIYQVEILDVNVEERPTYDTRNKSDDEKEYENVLNFQFTLLAGKDKDGSDLRGRSIWANFVPTYLYIGKNGKNKLYQIIESAIGRSLTTEEEVGGIDSKFLNGLTGKQIRVGIKNKTKDDKTYSQIETFYTVDEDKTPLLSEEKAKAMPKDKEDNQDDSEKELADAWEKSDDIEVEI